MRRSHAAWNADTTTHGPADATARAASAASRAATSSWQTSFTVTTSGTSARITSLASATDRPV